MTKSIDRNAFWMLIGRRTRLFARVHSLTGVTGMPGDLSDGTPVRSRTLFAPGTHGVHSRIRIPSDPCCHKATTVVGSLSPLPIPRTLVDVTCATLGAGFHFVCTSQKLVDADCNFLRKLRATSRFPWRDASWVSFAPDGAQLCGAGFCAYTLVRQCVGANPSIFTSAQDF